MMRMGKVAVFVLALIAISVLIIGMARIYDRLAEREIEYSYLGEALHAPVMPVANLDWSPAQIELKRPFTEIDETVLGRALNEAWTAFYAAQDSGDVQPLSDYFQGAALERATHAAQSANNHSAYMVNISGDAKPTFYHLDGSVLQIAMESLAVRFIENQTSVPVFHPTAEETLTTLIREPAGWRIVAHQRLNSRPIRENIPTNRRFDRLAGINYYPADTPWREFWIQFNPFVIGRDFDRIAHLGANSVRIFLPLEIFGQDKPSIHLENFERLLNLAQSRGLKVVPTLFDLRGGYALTDWARDVQYLENVLPLLNSHDAIAFVDLKNEPDLDFVPHGRARVEAWLRMVALYIRNDAPNLALTVGWSDAQFTDIVAELLDVITYHEYQHASKTRARLADVTERANGKPVMITEIGETSWGLLSIWPSSINKQDERIATRLADLADASGVFVWTLHDFPNPDPAAIGRKPLVRAAQSAYGLYDQNGNKKPAFNSVSQAFAIFLKD